MNTTYKTHRNRRFQYYDLFPTKEDALEHLSLASSSFVSSLNLACRQEEARMEIKAIRAKQRDCDELATKQVEIKRTM